MVQLIVGNKGKGKTKHLLDKVNNEIKSITCLEGADITDTVAKLEKVSKATGVDFILSVSKDEGELPESVKKNILISL